MNIYLIAYSLNVYESGVVRNGVYYFPGETVSESDQRHRLTFEIEWPEPENIVNTVSLMDGSTFVIQWDADEHF